MAYRLPPLNALRAFEAAARELSFTKAAVELNVTPAAVGYQVRRLEDHLGMKLFHRLNRALVLTDAGRAFLPVVHEAFELLSKGSMELSAHEPERVLSVSVAQSLGAKWLVPRLDRFRARHPKLELRIDSTDELADFARDDVDVAVRYARRVDPDLYSVLVLVDQVFPVCSPALAAGAHPLRDPADLRHHKLLNQWQNDVTWSDWLRAAEAAGVDASHGPVFSHISLAVDAAIAGQGVALGRSPLVADDLESGRLVRPFDTALVSDLAYFVVCRPERANESKIRAIRAFRDWVLLEARGSEAVAILHARG
jgi:LysR family glycine cleavage system transcriptional activator